MEVIKDIPGIKGRAVDGHKGDYGKVCIVAGSRGMSGAAGIAGKSALRSGAGLVGVACPECIACVVACFEASYTTLPLLEDGAGRICSGAAGALLKAVRGSVFLVFGPGVGVSGEIRGLVEMLLGEAGVRILLDADGLNNLSKIPDWPVGVKADVILTPHPGEMARLWGGLFREELPLDRCQQAERLAVRSGATVVLKGAGTVVCDGERVYVNDSGNAGMATGGSGDCLTGVIAGLAGQGYSNFDAAVLGVYVHGVAGDITAEKFGQIGMIATDIVDALPAAFLRL